MNMVRVENNEIVKWQLPKVGTLRDGRTVSGYHLLDEEILKQEEWLPLEDIEPEYDEDSQYLIHDGYEILEDKVVVKYRIEDMPPIEVEISEIEKLKQENELLREAQAETNTNLLEFMETILMGGM